MEPQAVLVIPRSVGGSRQATNLLLWLRSAQRLACAPRTSRALASTHTNGAGTSHGCVPLSEPNAGRGWVPVRIICWSWLALWWKAALDRGRRAVST